jgi:hypothetical protein
MALVAKAPSDDLDRYACEPTAPLDPVDISLRAATDSTRRDLGCRIMTFLAGHSLDAPLHFSTR